MEDLREQLNTAMRLRSKPRLERVLNECEAAGYAELGPDMEKARQLMHSLGGGREG